MKYIHLFDTASEFNEAYNGSSYEEPWVSYTEENEKVKYNKSEDEKLKDTPLTFVIQSDGNITWKKYQSSMTDKTIEYSKNGGEWISITSDAGSSAPTISVVSGDTIQFRGNNTTYGKGPTLNTSFNTTCQFKVKGNIMSLITSTNFSNLVTLGDTYTFIDLFNGCTGLKDAGKLLLPATALTDYCYCSMFNGCSNLTKAPALPATTLANYCYASMFAVCTSLTAAPELPATVLAKSCYSMMFMGCTSLATAPALSATTLMDNCYNAMFQGCTSLTTAPELPATTLATGCYKSMFSACTGLVSVSEDLLPATTLAVSCYTSMFNCCTSLVTAPVLPATSLGYGQRYCYESMFSGCSSLNYIKAMFTTTPGVNYTYNWVAGVASTGTFVKNSAASWTTTGNNGIPTGWTVETAS